MIVLKLTPMRHSSSECSQHHSEISQYRISFYLHHVQGRSATRVFLGRSSCYRLTSNFRSSLGFGYTVPRFTARHEEQDMWRMKPYTQREEIMSRLGASGAGDTGYEKCSPSTSKSGLTRLLRLKQRQPCTQ
ncbi:hypothetical protein BDV97DRAFT_106314 [Delphinella strobiligena]|nr:hypothetical protein BDV97DRAFT_106314 [Delphinella strobiligena]